MMMFVCVEVGSGQCRVALTPPTPKTTPACWIVHCFVCAEYAEWLFHCVAFGLSAKSLNGIAWQGASPWLQVSTAGHPQLGHICHGGVPGAPLCPCGALQLVKWRTYYLGSGTRHKHRVLRVSAASVRAGNNHTHVAVRRAALASFSSLHSRCAAHAQLA